MSGKTVAYIASLDTKLKESLFAREVLERAGCGVLMIDVSTRGLLPGRADVGPAELLGYLSVPVSRLAGLGKADCIDLMTRALAAALPRLYAEGRFDGVLSVGGGQNAKIAATAIKQLPFGVPKLVASSLAAGKRTMEQYVGASDVLVMHTVADISGLNAATRTVISNACHAVAGMVNNLVIYGTEKTTIGATMLGITSKGVEGALRAIPDARFEKICFHANGVGGRCLENLIEAGKVDIVLDMTLHEITCEFLGGYCSGAKDRLLKAIEKRMPMVVVPGALDMLDFFIDEEGNGLPADIERRKRYYHNDAICHSKVFADEAEHLARVVCQRLNLAQAPTTLVLPLRGFCEAAASGGPLYDPQVDAAFAETFARELDESRVKLVRVDANINDGICYRLVAKELLALAGGE